MKLKLSSDDNSIDTSFKQFNIMALVVESLIEKVSYSTSIEVSFCINKIVTFGFTTSIILRIS